MDNRAGEMGVFVAVAEGGGFSAAGRKLGLSPSAVSKLIGRLEDRLGTPLFIRSTRSLQVTAEGGLFLERARRILADIEAAERLVGTGATAIPRGTLRVSSSVGFGECCVLPRVPEFLALYPQIELDISLTDAVIDLMDERTDVALRSGPLRDSSLIARKLLETHRTIVAAPAYLARYGMPETPAELAQHNCLRFNFRRTQDDWPFRDPTTKQSYSLPVSGNFLGNTGVVVRHAARAGLGLARLGHFQVAEDIARGDLVPVLEAHNAGEIELIHAVYMNHTHLAARLRVFVDFLAARVGKPIDRSIGSSY